MPYLKNGNFIAFKNKREQNERDLILVSKAFFELFSKKKRPTVVQMELFLKQFHADEVGEYEDKKFKEAIEKLRNQ